MAEDKSMIFKSSSFYGMLLGLFWAFKYLFVMFGYNSSILTLIYWILTTFTLIITYNMTRAYKLVSGGRISFFHAWQFGVLLYTYAALIVSLLHYVFYRFIAPPDFIMNAINNAINFMSEMNVDENMIEQYKEVGYLSPIQMVIQQIISNIFYGVILSIPIAWLASRKDDSDLIEKLKDTEDFE